MTSKNCAQLGKPFKCRPLAVRGGGLLHIISAFEVAATTPQLVIQLDRMNLHKAATATID